MNEEQLLERIKSGKLVEGPEYATTRYIEGLKRTLVVSGDTELISAPAYMRAAKHAPRINSYISVTGIVQDELGHAHIAYRLLRDLGVDIEKLVYERDPKDFRHPYAFDVPLDSWADMVVANAFYDRAGFAILDDVFQHSSYGPWKRALVKVEREENFHLRHGEQWVATMSEDPESKKELQAAMDWMFPMTLEWFGLPDSMKRHTEQIEYGMKGSTNDELRQTWMSTAVPLCEKHGLEVPAHYDAEREQWVLDYPFPCEFDEQEKRWLLDEGEITWEQVLERWKRRGPANEEFVEQLQRGYRQMAAVLDSDDAGA
ncbi:MAG: Phenylacetic acid catabolic protein [Solirubrobacteraceae bacterium]